ncbi:MAG: hypothetical protein A2418_00785 [Candidatus Brennerbacteria bacterium RIFOXYC1_FULL_41_11]|uniref:CMP/dCMP-type deaminase domain-containing protein n=1 Tax=Candidatus Brennerbacteria bacterium RIFOXYD1_FULL_41_16 TaxID=1797529 RepID=A0A1G1XL18_9BACT|nr:MAG: hypothetical protein A2391_03690 [Candidatus Brennerbacteria bacterium RIFOXYB1_FULL_41_13]OGY40416.1 MAG: hypothetical protein A2418_00785 [Candidatus Brennerbacteria bacterium RIFOXYC1_FULL_41_11]OGY40845.1 MAG: hypothetical protein A2570_00320 [Candidatus Brennerbacteria bacterium RIFOXYD1_FULL_41_16]
MTQEQEIKLIQAAQEGVKNAFTGTNQPGDFRVGSAVLTKDGNIYSSGQYASDTHSLTLHAEQAALAHAAAHGEYEIVVIATTANETAGGDKPVYPCHMCKQLLWESYIRSKQNVEIIIVSNKGEVLERFKLLDIIDHPWPTA